MLPKARKKDLLIQTVDDETLVYDLRNDEAHCLNRSAALVWKYCDGKTDIRAMTKKLSAATGTAMDTEVVRLALQDLRKANLLTEKTSARTAKGPTRREVLKKLGKTAAVTVPLITSIVAPEAAQAASCVPQTKCQAIGGGRTWQNRCCCDIGRLCTGTLTAPGKCNGSKCVT